MGFEISRIQLDQRSQKAFVEQIADIIRLDIVHGDLQPGDQLPTVRKLAQQLKLNFNTVARAYHLVESEGLIITRQGQGTFVLEPEISDVPRETPLQDLESLMQRWLEEMAASGYLEEDILFYLLEKELSPQANRRPILRMKKVNRIRKIYKNNIPKRTVSVVSSADQDEF